MDILRKYGLPVIIYLVAFYLAPYILIGRIDDGFGVVIINLFLINSVAVFFGTSYITYKFGIDWINLLVIALLYLGSCFVIWNSSAIGYLILYAIIGSLALLIGYFFRKNIRSQA